jgi:hypothetical protein
MANHPQCTTALTNVADLNKIYLEHQREAAREVEGKERAVATAARSGAGHHTFFSRYFRYFLAIAVTTRDYPRE